MYKKNLILGILNYYVILSRIVICIFCVHVYAFS